jgi:hypothetical protein
MTKSMNEEPVHIDVPRIQENLDSGIIKVPAGMTHEEKTAFISASVNKQGSLPIPFESISNMLNECMEIAVANGANSVSMPDEYVAVAHFISFPEKYGCTVEQTTGQRPTLADRELPPLDALQRIRLIASFAVKHECEMTYCEAQSVYNLACRGLSAIEQALAQYTYTSAQATNCAGCGQHKHTPLRVDAMGGYVCLTCIDKKLEDFFAQQVPVVDEREAFEEWISSKGVSVERLGADARPEVAGQYIECELGWEAWQARAALAQSPARMEPVAWYACQSDVSYIGCNLKRLKYEYPHVVKWRPLCFADISKEQTND